MLCFWFSAFCVFPSTIHTLLLKTLHKKITLTFQHILRGRWHYLFWDKDSNERPKNIYEIFLFKSPKLIIYFGIQQFYFGRKQKYLWKSFYTMKIGLLINKCMAFMDLFSSWSAVSPKCCLLMVIEAFIILCVQS